MIKSEIREQILNALKTFVEPGGVAELRIINKNDRGFTENYSGYFDDLEKMADEAAKYDGNAPAIYFTLQKCKPELLCRAANRMVRAVDKKDGGTTADHEILGYRWFPIDADASRISGISSTDEEHEAAIQKTRDIYKFLKTMGWPEPVVSDSGNGAHLCYRVDIPVDKETYKEHATLFQTALIALAQKFSDKKVDIDRTVFNPSRIWKLYGTIAQKGDVALGRVHRRAKIIMCPETLEVLPIEKIKELAAMAKEDKPEKQNNQSTGGTYSHGKIDVFDFCARHGLSIKKDDNYKDGHKYILDECPFDSSHKAPDSAIFQSDSGALSFKCFHNSCSTYGWRQLREKLEPGCYESRASGNLYDSFRKNYNGGGQQASIKIPIKPRVDIDKDKEQMYKELEMQLSGERVTIPLPWSRLSGGAKMLRPGSLTIIAGATKAGKSFFTTNIIKHVGDLGYEWAYLPLEDGRRDWTWRMMAIIENDYRMIDDDQETAQLRLEAFIRREKELDYYLSRITENPRIDVYNADGECVVPSVSHQEIIDWIKEAVKTARVIVVDPVSQIDCTGKESWNVESWFVRELLAITKSHDASIILVTHTRKRSGADSLNPAGADDVQGSSMFTKLAQTTIMIDACDPKEGVVYGIGGTEKTVTYDRVVTIAATRYGKGNHWRIAFSQNKQAPVFDEMGILKPKGAK